MNIPPNSLETEKYILGCILVDSECAEKLTKLNESDFYNKQNQAIFNTMSQLHQSKIAIDIISVSDKTKIDIGVLAEMAADTTGNFNYHFQQLKKYSGRRELIKKSMEVIELSYTGEYDELIDLKNDALQRIDIDIYENKKSNFELSNIIGETISNIDKRLKDKNEGKLYTGFYDLDKLTAGLHEEELTIVAARPGVGKTAFIIQMLIHLTKKNNQCILFSREMSKGQLCERVLANLSGVNSQKIRFAKWLDEDDWKAMTEASEEMFDMPLIINDEAVNIQEIRAFCREMHSKGKLNVIAIDYLQLCKTLKKTQTREREIAEISWECKQLSKEFKVPVIVLSQLSREGSKAGTEPQLHDLRDSGAIEQDADNVIFLHVPKDTDETQECFDIKIILSKQRSGPTGHIWLKYCRKNFRFWCKTNGG